MQDNSNYYVTQDRTYNASFKQKINPIAKNILRKQNPLELVFQDISTIDAENPIVGLLLQELDLGKKGTASVLIKKAPKPPATDFIRQNRLNKLRNDGNNNNNIRLLLPPAAPKDNFQQPPPPPPPSPSFNDFILPPPPPSPPTLNSFIVPPPKPLPSSLFVSQRMTATKPLLWQN